MSSAKKTKRSQSQTLIDPSITTPSILHNSPLFRGLPDHLLQLLIPKMHFRCYRRGDTIIREGQPARYLFLLLSGNASAYSERFECEMSAMESGAVFGEIGALFNIPRTATVRATSALCKVAAIDGEDLQEILASYPDLTQRLKERARLHLGKDSERLAFDTLAVSAGDLKLFQEMSKLTQAQKEEILASSECLKLKKSERILLSSDTILAIVKGHGNLFGPLARGQASDGAILADEGIRRDYDFYQAETLTVILRIPAQIYRQLINSNIRTTEEPSTMKHQTQVTPMKPWRHDPIAAHDDMEVSPRPKRQRVVFSGPVVDFSGKRDVNNASLAGVDDNVEQLILDGCLEISDPAVELVASRFKNLKILSINDCFKLTAAGLLELSKMSKLERLSMTNIEGVNDSVISCLPKTVEFLDISFCHNVSDVGCLPDGLKELSAKRTTFIECSRPLNSLRRLSLAECHLLSDGVFRMMVSECSLEWLDISSCQSLSTVSLYCIAKMKHLQHLSIQNCDRMVNDLSIAHLTNSLPKLRSLDVSYNQRLKHLFRMLQPSKSLKTVSIVHCAGLSPQEREKVLLRYGSGG